MRRIVGIGWLRGLAALLVLVSHVSYWCGGSALDVPGALLARGDVGVAVFFALSAFLLVNPDVSAHGPESVRRYARKRFARLVPTYWVVLAVVIAVAVWLGQSVSPSAVIAHVLLLPGFTLERFAGFSQVWSLTTEATFYLVVPALRRWLRDCLTSGRSPLPWLGAAAGASVLVQTVTATSGSPAWSVLTTSAAGHVAWFVAGIAVRLLVIQRAELLTTVFHWRRVLPWLLAGYVLIATGLGGPTDLSTPGLVPAAVKEIGYAGLAGASVVVALQVPDTPVSRPLGQLCGDLSYGVFLWHVVVLQVLFAGLGLPAFHAPIPLTLVATLSVSLLLARLTWWAVERPSIAWGHRQR